MAGAAVLFDFKEQGVAVAIDEPTQDLLGVAARFTFLPELLPRAAPVVHVTRRHGVMEGILVHPGHHQHPAAGLGALLHNGRNEAAIIIFQVQLHPVISEAMGFLRKKILHCGGRRYSGGSSSGSHLHQRTPIPLPGGCAGAPDRACFGVDGEAAG